MLLSANSTTICLLSIPRSVSLGCLAYELHANRLLLANVGKGSKKERSAADTAVLNTLRLIGESPIRDMLLRLTHAVETVAISLDPEVSIYASSASHLLIVVRLSWSALSSIPPSRWRQMSRTRRRRV